MSSNFKELPSESNSSNSNHNSPTMTSNSNINNTRDDSFQLEIPDFSSSLNNNDVNSNRSMSSPSYKSNKINSNESHFMPDLIIGASSISLNSKKTDRNIDKRVSVNDKDTNSIVLDVVSPPTLDPPLIHTDIGTSPTDINSIITPDEIIVRPNGSGNVQFHPNSIDNDKGSEKVNKPPVSRGRFKSMFDIDQFESESSLNSVEQNSKNIGHLGNKLHSKGKLLHGRHSSTLTGKFNKDPNDPLNKKTTKILDTVDEHSDISQSKALDKKWKTFNEKVQKLDDDNYVTTKYIDNSTKDGLQRNSQTERRTRKPSVDTKNSSALSGVESEGKAHKRWDNIMSGLRNMWKDMRQDSSLHELGNSNLNSNSNRENSIERVGNVATTRLGTINGQEMTWEDTFGNVNPAELLSHDNRTHLSTVLEGTGTEDELDERAVDHLLSAYEQDVLNGLNIRPRRDSYIHEPVQHIHPLSNYENLSYKSKNDKPGSTNTGSRREQSIHSNKLKRRDTNKSNKSSRGDITGESIRSGHDSKAQYSSKPATGPLAGSITLDSSASFIQPDFKLNMDENPSFENMFPHETSYVKEGFSNAQEANIKDSLNSINRDNFSRKQSMGSKPPLYAKSTTTRSKQDSPSRGGYDDYNTFKYDDYDEDYDHEDIVEDDVEEIQTPRRSGYKSAYVAGKFGVDYNNEKNIENKNNALRLIHENDSEYEIYTGDDDDEDENEINPSIIDDEHKVNRGRINDEFHFQEYSEPEIQNNLIQGNYEAYSKSADMRTIDDYRLQRELFEMQKQRFLESEQRKDAILEGAGVNVDHDNLMNQYSSRYMDVPHPQIEPSFTNEVENEYFPHSSDLNLDTPADDINYHIQIPKRNMDLEFDRHISPRKDSLDRPISPELDVKDPFRTSSENNSLQKIDTMDSSATLRGGKYIDILKRRLIKAERSSVGSSGEGQKRFIADSLPAKFLKKGGKDFKRKIEQLPNQVDPLRKELNHLRKKLIQVISRADVGKYRARAAEIDVKRKFVAYLCYAMMLYGAPSHRLEEYMQLCMGVLDLSGTVSYMPGVMTLNFTETDVQNHTQRSYAILIKAAGLDIGKLQDVFQVYKDVVKGNIEIFDAGLTLDAIIREPPYYSTIQLIFCYGLGSACACVWAYGGWWVDMPISFVLGCFTGFLVVFASVKNPIYSNVLEVTAGMVTSFVARGIASINGPQSIFCFGSVAESCITFILPGYIVLCGALELSSHSISAGSVRIMYSVIYSLLLAFGMQIGSQLWALVDDRIDTGICPKTTDPKFKILFVPLFVIMQGILVRARPYQFPMMIVIGGCGYTVSYFISLRASSIISSAVGAFTLGTLSHLYARICKTYAFPAVVVSIMLLVPSGLAAQGGLALGLSSNLFNRSSIADTQSQLYQSFTVGAQMIQVAISLTVGLLLSVLVMYPYGAKNTALFSF